MEVANLATQTDRCVRLELPPNQDPPSSCLNLLGKIISSQPIGLSTVKDVVLKAMKPVYPLEVNRLDSNVYMFRFQHEVDRHRAYQRRPWSIRGGHLILKQWSLELDWHEVDFTTSTFWVQVHGLPLLWNSEDNLKKIGSLTGAVLEVDVVGAGGWVWKKFTCINVEVDLSHPLLPGIFLPRTNLNDLWISLKYEKLATFCYNCGIIGHNESTCTGKVALLRNPHGHYFKASGPWLRVESEDVPPDVHAAPSPSPPVDQAPDVRIDAPTNLNPTKLQLNETTAANSGVSPTTEASVMSKL